MHEATLALLSWSLGPGCTVKGAAGGGSSCVHHILEGLLPQRKGPSAYLPMILWLKPCTYRASWP